MQPLLSSAGRQYGISSLDSDAFELDELAQHLKSFYNSKVRTLAKLNCWNCTTAVCTAGLAQGKNQLKSKS